MTYCVAEVFKDIKVAELETKIAEFSRLNSLKKWDDLDRK